MTKEEEIRRGLMEKYDLPYITVESIILSAFRELKEAMNRGNFESVMFPILGKFVVTDRNKEKAIISNQRKRFFNEEKNRIHAERALENSLVNQRRLDELSLEEGPNREVSREEKENM